MEFVILFSFLAFCGIATSFAIAFSKYDFDYDGIDEDLCDKMLSLDETLSQVSHMNEDEIKTKFTSLKKNRYLRSIAKQVLSDLDEINKDLIVMEDLKSFCTNKALVSSSVEKIKKHKESILDNCRSILTEVFSTGRKPNWITLEDVNYMLIRSFLEENSESINQADALRNEVSKPIMTSNHLSNSELSCLIKSIEQKAVSQ